VADIRQIREREDGRGVYIFDLAGAVAPLTCGLHMVQTGITRAYGLQLRRMHQRWKLVRIRSGEPQTPHMRVGPSRLALIDVGGNLDKKPYCLIGECSRDVERCLTNRAPVASLVLGPSRSSFSVSLIKAY
jgi:hypothetical protein